MIRFSELAVRSTEIGFTFFNNGTKFPPFSEYIFSCARCIATKISTDHNQVFLRTPLETSKRPDNMYFFVPNYKSL